MVMLWKFVLFILKNNGDILRYLLVTKLRRGHVSCSFSRETTDNDAAFAKKAQKVPSIGVKRNYFLLYHECS